MTKRGRFINLQRCFYCQELFYQISNEEICPDCEINMEADND